MTENDRLHDIHFFWNVYSFAFFWHNKLLTRQLQSCCCNYIWRAQLRKKQPVFMSGYFHIWSVHKNTNNKTSIGFFGLSCYCWYLFFLPIQEKVLLNLIPKAQELVSASFFFFFSKDKFHFPVSAVQKDVYWSYQVPPTQLSLPLEGAHGETRSHIICVSLRRKMEKFDLTQG